MKLQENSCSGAAGGMTRRGLLAALAALGAVMPFRSFFFQTSFQARQAIVSFHMDQPYLDWSGTAVPYDPPPGTRSAQGVADLSEEMFRRHFICP
jgi:hypothetical protein